MAQHVDYDTDLRIIYVTTAPVNGEVPLDVQIDLYSDVKEDWQSTPALNRFAMPISSVGGNPLPGSKVLGDTYFLNSDWKIRPYEADHKLAINGNLFSVDGTSVVVPTIGNYNVLVEMFVSNLSDSSIAQLAEIEYASFGGGVHIDVANISGKAIAGTAFPAGNAEYPSTNTTDALAIAQGRGFGTINVIGNLALGAGDTFERFEFIGESALKTIINVASAAEVLDCEFYDCKVTGVLDGNSHIEKALVDDIEFVDGYIHKCALGPALITLGTSTIANFFSCYSTVPGTSTPEIDMNETGQLALRDYNGGMKLSNYTGSGSHSVDLASGQIVLTTTITSGTFVIRGVGKLVDESGEVIPSGTWNSGVTIVNETVLNQMLTIDDLILVKEM